MRAEMAFGRSVFLRASIEFGRRKFPCSGVYVRVGSRVLEIRVFTWRREQ